MALADRPIARFRQIVLASELAVARTDVPLAHVGKVVDSTVELAQLSDDIEHVLLPLLGLTDHDHALFLLRELVADSESLFQHGEVWQWPVEGRWWARCRTCGRDLGSHPSPDDAGRHLREHKQREHPVADLPIQDRVGVNVHSALCVDEEGKTECVCGLIEQPEPLP